LPKDLLLIYAIASVTINYHLIYPLPFNTPDYKNQDSSAIDCFFRK